MANENQIRDTTKMIRLIDANEIEELFYKQVEWGATDLMDAFDDALQDAQTVDAVEVVRCKDCKHYSTRSPYGGVFYKFPICHSFRYTTKTTDFCSYGERKDNEI